MLKVFICIQLINSNSMYALYRKYMKKNKYLLTFVKLIKKDEILNSIQKR